MEAKRAVPRSEASTRGDAASTKTSKVTTSSSSGSSSTPQASPVLSSSRSSSTCSRAGSASGRSGSTGSSASSTSASSSTSSPPSRSRGPPSPVVPTSTRSSSGSVDEYAFCKIFVGGLHYDTRDGEFALNLTLFAVSCLCVMVNCLLFMNVFPVEFRSYFEKYGKVLSAEVMFNRETHKSRGFGFIVFESERGVDAVCAQREHTIDGKLVSHCKSLQSICQRCLSGEYCPFF